MLGVLDVIADVNLLENEDVILYLIDMFNGGSAPREVSEVSTHVCIGMITPMYHTHLCRHGKL